MASRTDQLQSYQFRTRRVLAALVMRETDPRQSPLRRGVGAVFGGVMLSVLVAAGFGIYGLVTKVGGNDWRVNGSVIVERETGASYVYINDTLYPTLNLASAMLVANQAGTIHRVASSSLAEVPRGYTIGIPGAPDSLPPAEQAIGLPWTVCARTETTNNVRLSLVDLAVGVDATGGTPLGGQALVVRDTGPGLTYLVVGGRRHLVKNDDAVVRSVFGDPQRIIEVGPAWINALPAGRDIAPIEVERKGRESNALDGYLNGDVVVHSIVNGEQFYLVLDDGVAPLNKLQLAVLEATASDPVTPKQILASQVGRISPKVPAPSDLDPPDTAPVLAPVGDSDAICATTKAGQAEPAISVGASVDGMQRGTLTEATSAAKVPLANRVLVPGGRVAIVHATPVVLETEGNEAPPTSSYLVVTDLGVAYPVPDSTVLPSLGYQRTDAVDIPAPLVSLIPLGPALDPAAAAQTMVLR